MGSIQVLRAGSPAPCASNPVVNDVQTASAKPNPMGSDRVQAGLALGLCLAVVLFQTLAPEFRRPVADAMGYARMAAALGDAMRGDWAQINEHLGTFIGPVYPVFGAAIAAVDGDLLQALKCVSQDGAVCDLSGLTSLFAVQGVFVALTLFLLFLAIRRIVGDVRVAWLALLIMLAAKTFANYASLILTECPTFFLFSLFIWLLARIATDPVPSGRVVFAAGLALAGAALSRPPFLYLFYVMVPVVGLWLVMGRGCSWRRSAAYAALFAVGGGVILMPWVLRNYVFFDLPAVSGGYGTSVMVERLAYNTMSWREWGVSFICWLPDFGDSLARALFPEDLWKRLGWYHPDSFYMMGRGPFSVELRAAAAAQENALGYLLREYVWADLGKHIAVTFSLAMRGQWAGKYVGLTGFVLLPACAWILHRRGRLGPFLLFCLPPYFMLGLYAFVSVSVVRYNEPLIAIFSLSAATVILFAADCGLQRLRDARIRQ
jgi:hypothetical protein